MMYHLIYMIHLIYDKYIEHFMFYILLYMNIQLGTQIATSSRFRDFLL